MSDFPDLGSEFATAPSSAIDDIDFDRAASAFPDISLDGGGDFPATNAYTSPNAGQAGGFSFDNFDSFDEPSAPQVKVTGDDEIEKFEDQFPELDTPVAQSAVSPPINKPSFGAPSPFAPRPQPSSFASPPVFGQVEEEEEPQVIKDWRAAQEEEIHARDEKSKKSRAHTISEAESSIDAFYEDHAKRKERNIRENKDAEEEYLANLTSSLTEGTTWERIAKLVELENSQSKTIARAGPGTTDLTRFKEVLLRLKREGNAAPGAAGY